MVSSLTNVPNERLLATVVDRINTVHFEKHTICLEESITNEYHDLFVEAIDYVLDTLIKEKGISVRHINVIGDTTDLMYSEYDSKRSTGTFYRLREEIKKGTVLHDSCKEIYERLKKKKLRCHFDGWRISRNGNMYSFDKNIRNRLERLAGNKYFDREKAYKEYVAQNEYGLCIENIINALIHRCKNNINTQRR